MSRTVTVIRPRPWALLCAALALCGLIPPASALINPKFTPVHLVEQSDTILTVKLKDAKPIGDKVEFQTIETLKGKAPASLVVDLSKAAKDQADAARKHLGEFGGEPCLFFSGKNGEESLYFLHVHAKWLRLDAVAGGGFELADFDDGKMRETWNGGTNMLIRCAQYVLADKDSATVTSVAGTNWASMKKIGAVTGAARNIAAVDLTGDGKLTLFIASEKGDQLFTAVKDDMQDVTAKLKLKSASRLSAWGDFNGDGRATLISCDGKTLTVWSQAADGTFASAPAGGTLSLPGECNGLAAVGLPGARASALLVSGTSGAPVLLKAAGKGAFTALALPAASADVATKLGRANACVVADFNGDSLLDIVQPFEKGGLIYLGNAAGGFDAPKACAVRGTPPDAHAANGAANGGGKGGANGGTNEAAPVASAKAVVADFVGDGHAGVLMADDNGMTLFQNFGDGTFEEVLQYSGEVFKAQGSANWCGVADFNNDARQDLYVTHPDSGVQIFFSRGFRSYGEAPDLEELTDIPEAKVGQQMALFADLRNVGAQDLVMVLNNGEIWWVVNDVATDNALCVRARLSAKAPAAGPVNVSLWKESRCLGSAVTHAGGPAAYFGIPDAGSFTLKWTLPGGKEVSKSVTVEKPVDVVIGDQ